MALIVKGFVTDSGFIDNSPNTVASVFELSDKGYTYSRDKTTYSLAAYPANDLIVFKSIDTNNGNRFTLDNTTVGLIMQLVGLIKAYPDTHIAPYVKNDYINHLQVQMGVNAININIGDFVQHGTRYYPKWFRFTTTDVTPKDIHIYISDTEFVNQYDGYEIVIVPPLPDTTDFNGFYNQAVNKLTLETYDRINDRIELAKGDIPNTYTRILEFDFFNKDNITVSTKTYWGAIVYGEAGNDIDYIKDAIEDYILSNVNNVRSHWEIIFPDIFRRTEFLILPLWHKIAITNLGPLSNLYSSMLSTKEVKNFITTKFNDIYTNNFIDDNLVLFPYDYKAISIAAISGTTNLPDRDQLFEVFNDYVPVNTSSLDFMRMREATRNWMIKLEEALLLAETYDEFASLPLGYRRVTRGTRHYVGFYYNQVNYLVAYRFNSFYS